MVLLAIPVYYFAVGFVVLPSTVVRPDAVMSGWEGPLRITLTCVPFIALLCLAIAAALRSGRGPFPTRPATGHRGPGHVGLGGARWRA